VCIKLDLMLIANGHWHCFQFFYDVLKLLAVDSQIASYASSERDLLYKHLEYAMEDDLLLLDRGYPSMAFFFLTVRKKTPFFV